MKALQALAAAAATVLSLGVQADEYYGAMYAQEVQSERSRAEVRAELLASAPQLRAVVQEGQPLPDRQLAASREREEVRQEAAMALRNGGLPHGEAEPS